MKLCFALAKGRKPSCKVVAVSTAQEEIGTRGAITSAYLANPDVALAVDVSHATDHPDADHRKYGRFTLGGGPILTRGPNIHPAVFDRLVECAEKANIPVQIEADPRPTGYRRPFDTGCPRRCADRIRWESPLDTCTRRVR
jgi:endoglucanase